MSTAKAEQGSNVMKGRNLSSHTPATHMDGWMVGYMFVCRTTINSWIHDIHYKLFFLLLLLFFIFVEQQLPETLQNSLTLLRRLCRHMGMSGTYSIY